MKIIIGTGKVANILRDQDDVLLSHKQIEITDINSIESNLANFPAGSIIINTAAKINLEWCESNKKESKEVNVDGAINVAKTCQKYDHHLVHIGSGCIFDGMETEKFFNENDSPSPASWYAVTKSDADKGILELGHKKVTIVRPRQLISSKPHPTNMITKFNDLSSGEFIDSKNSITCIEDMKAMIDHLISNNHYGIYNLANVGTISPYQIANKIKHKLNSKLIVDRISYEDYLKKISVKRVNTILDVGKLVASGYTPRNAMAALNWCLENYGK